MTITLPKPIFAYFAADGKDGAEIAQCFTETAIVVDERQTYTGRDAIRRWKTETAGKYTYVVTPHAIEDVGDQTIVTSRLTGNFPGSPIDLRYIFNLEGASIARLEIKI